MSTSYRKINTLYIVVVIVTLLVVVAIIYPVYWLLMLSLKTELEAFKIPPSFVFIPTFEHYYKLVGGSDFLHSFGNSAICSTGSVLLAILIGTPAAYALSRLKFKFDGSRPMRRWCWCGAGGASPF